MLVVEKTKLEAVLKITPPTVFEDFRGFYIELYNEELYKEALGGVHFAQDDVSISSKHVLRGIHGDRHTYKLISCILGRIYLVIVDCRESSPQFRQWESFIISADNHYQILVPPGFGVAHLVLSDQAMFHYKQSSYYDRSSQFTKLWNDPELNIWWPVKNPLISQRDGGLE
ncbi:MAG: dTDP-4-keto-6-deoxy-D-glucose epimerase [Geobacteraceae bacterium]|nr:dTDP-4-keto-6-deoxy-D-glucose epimerase [Geobacteraceae bacterium]NTW79387.1 dTDP-4-keto-6-deoxy-D-glucose epimerase [Geobacteraceae bacterium]